MCSAMKAETRCWRSVDLSECAKCMTLLKLSCERLRPHRAEDCESEVRCQRKVALGVGPQRHWKSACGHTEARTVHPRRGVSDSSRWGGAPAPLEKRLRPHRAEDCASEARCQR